MRVNSWCRTRVDPSQGWPTSLICWRAWPAIGLRAHVSSSAGPPLFRSGPEPCVTESAFASWITCFAAMQVSPNMSRFRLSQLELYNNRAGTRRRQHRLHVSPRSTRLQLMRSSVSKSSAGSS